MSHEKSVSCFEIVAKKLMTLLFHVFLSSVKFETSGSSPKLSSNWQKDQILVLGRFELHVMP
jgi:hypothetical protein